MKYSAQEEYGLRCLLQVARVGLEGSISIPEIARNEALTPTHVAKLLMILRKDGYINSTRGQAGGYALARQPNEIVVGEVLASLGGKLYDDEFCNKHATANPICTQAVDCAIRSLWQLVQTTVDSVLNELTLADLMKTKEPVSNVQLYDLPRRTQPILN
ncbi:MAG: Rrf2 family transcriptional regulator [Fimbriimonas sp.]